MHHVYIAGIRVLTAGSRVLLGKLITVTLIVILSAVLFGNGLGTGTDFVDEMAVNSFLIVSQYRSCTSTLSSLRQSTPTEYCQVQTSS